MLLWNGSGNRKCTTAHVHDGSFWIGGNILKLIKVMVVEIHKYTKRHELYLKMSTFYACKLHLNKADKMSETWGVLQGTTVLLGIWAPESIIISESFPTCVQMCVKVTEGCVCACWGGT